ncbi:hypothetical protein Sango_0231900 [Sesamum angolense]|uniref:RNase H type-1 domain-containing protein n=1 Tax=Sesamum angolense TaxID=2727404 RepID=A0AAE2C776_9LAMI|nr:hypothetical protein Sango_0231900 [Sesamum angolense]
MELPAVGWINLNLDGASKGKPGEAGAGGLLCDHIDIVLAAFYEFPGFRTNLYAKFMAVFRGSEISIELGHCRMWIEVAASLVISIVNSDAWGNWQYQDLVVRIRSALLKVEFKLKVTFREEQQKQSVLLRLTAGDAICRLRSSNYSDATTGSA